MGKTIKHQQLILLDPEKAALLDELAAETRIAKQVLLREAVDDLLTKHGKSEAVGAIDREAKEVPPSKVVKFKTKNMLAADKVFDPSAKQLGFDDSDDMMVQYEELKRLRREKRAKRKKSGSAHRKLKVPAKNKRPKD